MHRQLDVAQTLLHHQLQQELLSHPAAIEFGCSYHFQFLWLTTFPIKSFRMCVQAQEVEEELGHDCMDEALDGALLLTMFVYLLLFLRYLCERQGKENNSDPK